jgi:hypothetical protein
MIALIAGAAAQAKLDIGPPERTVVVCTALDPRSFQARALASEMFAAIGVTMMWRAVPGCPEEGIRITLTENTPDSLLPGALAYALPYEGTHIRVLYDRVAQFPKALLPHLLAHVLVHEITHILQGVAQHSSQGIMKARWDRLDRSRMLRRSLGFTE